MCVIVTCQKCGKKTWKGCGEHVEMIFRDVPTHEICRCDSLVNDDKSKDDIMILDGKMDNDTSSNGELNGNIEVNNDEVLLECIQSINKHEDTIWCCKFSPNKKILGTTSSDKTIKLWIKNNNNNKYKCIQTLNGHTKTVRNISWYGNNIFASAGFDKMIGIWKRNNDNNDIEFELIDMLDYSEKEVKSISWNGNILASCTRDKFIYIYEMELNDDNEYELILINQFIGHNGDIKYLTFNNNNLITCSYDNTIKIWNNNNIINNDDEWNCLQTIKYHKSTVWYCDFNKNGNQFISCSDDKSIGIYNLINNNGIKYFKLINNINNLHNDTIYCCKYFNNNNIDNIIVTCSADNSIKFIQLINNDNNDNNELQYNIFYSFNNAHETEINCIDLGPIINNNKQIITSVDDDGILKIWEFTYNNKNVSDDNDSINTETDNDIILQID